MENLDKTVKKELENCDANAIHNRLNDQGNLDSTLYSSHLNELIRLFVVQYDEVINIQQQIF